MFHVYFVKQVTVAGCHAAVALRIIPFLLLFVPCNQAQQEYERRLKEELEIKALKEREIAELVCFVEELHPPACGHELAGQHWPPTQACMSSMSETCLPMMTLIVCRWLLQLILSDAAGQVGTGAH